VVRYQAPIRVLGGDNVDLRRVVLFLALLLEVSGWTALDYRANELSPHGFSHDPYHLSSWLTCLAHPFPFMRVSVYAFLLKDVLETWKANGI